MGTTSPEHHRPEPPGGERRAPSGPELLLDLDRARGRSLRSQLEVALRHGVRSGTLPSGMRLPASRVLAGDLGVSRRLVVEAYAQLLAEGYLVARAGAGTFVADSADAAALPDERSEPAACAFDFFPGNPDLMGFPRRAWARALRESLRDASAASLGYPPARGAVELRHALAGHLRRVRGVVADPDAIVVVSGATQGLALIASALGRRPHIALEDPGLPPHRVSLAHHGARLSYLAVDGRRRPS